MTHVLFPRGDEDFFFIARRRFSRASASGRVGWSPSTEARSYLEREGARGGRRRGVRSRLREERGARLVREGREARTDDIAGRWVRERSEGGDFAFFSRVTPRASRRARFQASARTHPRVGPRRRARHPSSGGGEQSSAHRRSTRAGVCLEGGPLARELRGIFRFLPLVLTRTRFGGDSRAFPAPLAR